MSQISLITISLSPPYPVSGMVPVIVRVTGHDKNVIDLAASQMGITRSQLMRMLLVKGAERILREFGVEIEYEQNKYVDLSKGETRID